MLEQMSEVRCGIGDGSVCTLYGFQPGTVHRDRLTARRCGPGFEVVYFSGGGDGCRIEGWTTAIQDGATWAVEYAIEVDAAGATRSAAIRGRSGAGFCTARLGTDGNGHWLVNSKPAHRAITQCHKGPPQPAQHPYRRARRIAEYALRGNGLGRALRWAQITPL